ncbi:MAG: AAA family ATPase, partial [Planctomycetota bacterium]
MASSGWELSEGHTAVVGRNGSGKSNIFEALEFVLCSSRFGTLRPSDRQRLLNGTSAFVEVVLENRGGRLPRELGEEVVLRRCLGLKKDEFFVNRRRVVKKEVESLLDHGGLHSSTFVLRQGSVSALCAAKDEERLELVKELGGAASYQAGRSQTAGILAETEAKASDAARDIDLIENRLDELEGEKDELQEYERLERRRRAIAYALYDAELRETTQELKDAEDTENDEAGEDKTEMLWNRKRRCREEVDACKDRVDRARAAYASARDVVDERRGAMSRVATRRARLNTQLEHLQRAVENDEKVKASMRRALRAELHKLASDLPDSSSSSQQQRGQRGQQPPGGDDDAVVATKRREAAAAFARARSAREEAATLSERVAETVAKRSAIASRAREARLDAERCEDE